MNRPLRLFLTLLVVVAVAVPVSVVATILLFPFWSWIEAATGFESVGHSGPAVWCYAAVFLVLAVGGALVAIARGRQY
jgi:uncharacterized integral membrane protein